MKKIYFLFLIFSAYSIGLAQPPCTLSLDSVYLDSSVSSCNHLFFKYKVSGGTATSYSWTYGDGNSCSCIKPKNVYTKNGNFQVCGRIQDAAGCADSMCITVNVNCSNPCDLSGIGIYSFDTLSYSCNEFEFITITSSNAKKIKWNFGDGDSSDTKYSIHTYKKNGTYNVRLIIQDSIQCADTADLQVQINCPVKPECDFKITSLDTQSGSNCKSKHFELSCNTVPKFVYWDFGDGQSEYNEMHREHIYSDTGVYEVCVVAEDSSYCRDTICFQIPVKCPKSSSIELSEQEEFYLFPQPFSEELNIFTNSEAELLIYSSDMKFLEMKHLHTGMNTILTDGLGSGVYILTVIKDYSLNRIKIIKY